MSDFSNHPASISELKSNLSNSAADWHPRDVLIKMLRDIDDGIISADALIVVWKQKTENGREKGGYWNSSPNLTMSVGMLETAKYEILKDDS